MRRTIPVALLTVAAMIAVGIGVNSHAATSSRSYPSHTSVVSTTFWVGELFNATAADGSQVCSTYDSQWAKRWSGKDNGSKAAAGTDCAGAPLGGCDGVPSGSGPSFACATERRTAANGFFPTSPAVTPQENPFYLDLPFDDVNDSTAFRSRGSVIPWANDPGYAGNAANSGFSYMKNRWVKLTMGGNTCYGQIQDAGPAQYHHATYVFGSNDARPANREFNNAGMDVSPALNGCLGFASLDGQDDRVNWSFVENTEVPAGPWTKVVTTSQVEGARPTAAYLASIVPGGGSVPTVSVPSATVAPSVPVLPPVSSAPTAAPPVPGMTATSTPPAVTASPTRSCTRKRHHFSRRCATPRPSASAPSAPMPSAPMPSTPMRSTTEASGPPSGSSGAVKAFDTTATVTDPQWFRSMFDRGYRLYVLHSTSWGTCSAWERTQPQIRMALDAGLKVAAYTRDPRCWQGGIAATGPYAAQLQFFALDVESDPGVRVTREMVDGVRSMGVRPVIYTGSGMWPEVAGENVTTFADVPLWDTDVRGPVDEANFRANLVSPRPVAYGGWNTPSTMRVGVQQGFEVQVNGVAIDTNSFAAVFLR